MLRINTPAYRCPRRVHLSASLPLGRSRGALGRVARFAHLLGDLVLLTNARFIRKPNLYFPNIDGLFVRDFIQARWELFLKSSIAPSACA